MRRFWKIILLFAAVLLLAGIILGGTGYLTGASPDRIAELAFGGWSGLRSALAEWETTLRSLY